MNTFEIERDKVVSKLFYNRTIPEPKPNWQDKSCPIVKHYHKWEFFNQNKSCGAQLKQGNFFLYENWLSEGKPDAVITYPRIGIYLHSLVCDQTLEIEWVDYRRTIEHNSIINYKSEYAGKKYDSVTDVSEIPSKINSIILWSDSMLVYGIWDRMPDWKTLRRSYENTWWYHKTTEEKRDSRIDMIL